MITYGRLGTFSEKVGKYKNALDYNLKALKIEKKILKRK